MVIAFVHSLPEMHKMNTHLYVSSVELLYTFQLNLVLRGRVSVLKLFGKFNFSSC